MTAIRLRRLVIVLIFGTLFGGLASPIIAATLEESPYGGTSQLDELLLAHELFDRVFVDNDADAAALLVAEHATISTRYGDFTGPDGLLEYLRIVKGPYLDVELDITSVQLYGALTVTWRMTGSMYNVATYNPVIIADVTQNGTATIVFQNGRLAHLTSQAHEVAFTERPGETLVSVPQRGQDY